MQSNLVQYYALPVYVCIPQSPGIFSLLGLFLPPFLGAFGASTLHYILRVDDIQWFISQQRGMADSASMTTADRIPKATPFRASPHCL